MPRSGLWIGLRNSQVPACFCNGLETSPNIPPPLGQGNNLGILRSQGRHRMNRSSSLSGAGLCVTAIAFFLTLGFTAAHPGAVSAQTVQGAHLQDGIHTAVGYAGVLPDALRGGSILHRFSGRPFGLFADFKETSSSLLSDEDYCPAGARPPVVSACTIDAVQAVWNDIPIRDVPEYRIFNVGALYAVSPELALMVGGGLVRSHLIREFSENIDRESGEDPRVSEYGRYYVPLEEDPTWTTQVVVGGLFRAGPRLLLRVGYETAPGGISVGGYLVVR